MRPRQRRIGNGNAVNAVAQECIDRSGKLYFRDIGRDLHDDRLLRLTAFDELGTRSHQAREKVVERFGRLKVSEPRRVRRRYVDCEEARHIVKRVEAHHIIACAVGAVLVGADVDAQKSTRRLGLQRDKALAWPSLLKPKRLMTARSGSSRKTRGRGFPVCGRGVVVSDLGKAEAHAQNGVGYACILVEAGCYAERIWELEPHRFNGKRTVFRIAAARVCASSRARSVISCASSGLKAKSKGLATWKRPDSITPLREGSTEIHRPRAPAAWCRRQVWCRERRKRCGKRSPPREGSQRKSCPRDASSTATRSKPSFPEKILSSRRLELVGSREMNEAVALVVCRPLVAARKRCGVPVRLEENFVDHPSWPHSCPIAD